MDFDTYKQRHFADPAPEPRFGFVGLHGMTLYFSEYEAAVAYYACVLGPPAHAEDEHTRGWRIGGTWLTLLRGKTGGPSNVEVTLVMRSGDEAERLHAAFVEAGGRGEAPSDQLMYEPVRYCPVTDPFGTNILIVSPLVRGGA
jgi:hypothetical protein